MVTNTELTNPKLVLAHIALLFHFRKLGTLAYQAHTTSDLDCTDYMSVNLLKTAETSKYMVSPTPGSSTG